MGIRKLSLLVGTLVPVPVHRDVSDALERVEIETAIGERGTFRLTFDLDGRPHLPEQFLLSTGDLLRVVLVLNEAGISSVVMDGVMVALKPPKLDFVPLEEAVAQLRMVPLDGEAVMTARGLGICFGD